MLAPINVDRHCRICACNCSGTYYFFRSSCRHSVVCRWQDRKPRRRLTKLRDKAMRLTPFARTSFCCSLCGALLQHGRRQCSVIAVSKGILFSIMYLIRQSCFRIRGSLVGYFAAMHFGRFWPISAAPVVYPRVRYWAQSSRAFGRAARQFMTLSGHLVRSDRYPAIFSKCSGLPICSYSLVGTGRFPTLVAGFDSFDPYQSGPKSVVYD
jgi:hypothetical protein